MQLVSEILAGSGTWTGPVGVTGIIISMIGAGGAGAGTGASFFAAGGGGGGEFVLKLPLMIDSGEVISYTVGAAGAGVANAAGNDGADTTFGAGAHFDIVTCKGGKGCGASNTSGIGGGRLGATAVTTTNTAPAAGYELPYWTGGTGGGPYVNAVSLLLSYPGPVVGYVRQKGDPQSGAHNVPGGSGGGEGAPSPWGWGGFGGDGGTLTADPGSVGGAPAATSFGAGGGGAGARGSTGTGSDAGGNGMAGTIEIFYFL